MLSHSERLVWTGALFGEFGSVRYNEDPITPQEKYMFRVVPTITTLYLLGSLAACGSSNSNQVGGAPNGTSADSQAAQQSSSAADDAGATDGMKATGVPAAMLALELAQRIADVSATTTFKVGGCTGQVAYTTAATSTGITITATDIFSNDSCTGDLKLSGSQNILITTDLTDTARTVQVSGALTRTVGDKDQVAISSLDAGIAYMYKLVSTGAPLSGDVNVMININEHRVRTANGNTVFDHNIITPATAGVTLVAAYDNNGAPKSRTIVAGEIDVHHNIALFTAKHTYNSLFHDVTGDCACPSNGSITQVVTSDANDWTYTRTYAFTGCGEATVITSGSTKSDTGNGTATIKWDGCSN